MEGSRDLLIMRAAVSQLTELFHELMRDGRDATAVETELRRQVGRLARMEGSRG